MSTVFMKFVLYDRIDKALVVDWLMEKKQTIVS